MSAIDPAALAAADVRAAAAALSKARSPFVGLDVRQMRGYSKAARSAPALELYFGALDELLTAHPALTNRGYSIVRRADLREGALA